MANAPLKKIITFYCRFTPSYSAIGFYARRLFWRRTGTDFAGQTWLVTGGSEGIGGSAARQAVAGGATVISVARDLGKLKAFAASVKGSGKVLFEVADLSLQEDIRSLLTRLEERKVRIDVLVNNVGIQKRDQILTKEGLETSFSTNILGHYHLTRELLARKMLSENAAVIEVSSGGMYNHALAVKDLNITGSGYLGVRAYGLAKRAQVVLTGYWRQKYAATGKSFYAMHPGWVDTASVGRSMPRFRAMLKSVLRDHSQGADTIVWLAAKRPKQAGGESIWFDRKERSVHIFPHTPKTSDTAADLIATLDSFLQPGLGRAMSAERDADSRQGDAKLRAATA
ncbi:SDR family NAD(P)-dependent oxidoreductase [Polaromonas sp. C04]|uniref:SDR family NAD(P)-dependent oxidoreductase n=1 Tax=Polaromonas sp. C04 TaxID=1945857 RepID=UPI0009868F4E|nr:SDR family NAD(P)-dependent oxidoreductase [Polaromonas sp. C04]